MIEVPATYFGRGKNYILKDTPEELQWFEERFKQYEADHPEDPTGEIALAEAEKRGETTARFVHSNPDPFSKTEDDELDSTKLTLELPSKYISKLKNFARWKRRRPRDIVMVWIEAYCKL